MILVGIDSLDYLAEELFNRGHRRIFIVSDEIIVGLGFVDHLSKIFKNKGFMLKVFSEVEAEPTFENVEKAVEKAKTFNPDTIAAVGGGSVIDTAKGVWVKLEKPTYDLHEVSPMQFIGVGRKITLIAIPTTSGTGSEATLGMVLSEKTNGKTKYALGSYELVPYISVLDPSFPAHMPRTLTIGTALDALSHASEALVSITASHFTDALALKTIELIYRYLPQVLDRPEDIEMREHIHLAAMMGGMAFSNSGLGLAHAMAHTLGPMMNVHHGAMVASILPQVIKFNSERSKMAKQKYEYAAKILNASLGGNQSFLERLLNFYKSIGHPACLEYYGISTEWAENNIDKIVMGTFSDPDLGYNPVMPSDQDIKNLVLSMIRCQ